ncbi:MAG: lytic murein transglycosylase, partial [Rhodobacteraceae bacterium]|nr:lytic murein transglycosylase [Paracoccaceae bacterium]
MIMRFGEDVTEGQETRASGAGFAEWAAGLRGRALAQGIGAGLFDTAFAGLSPDPDVIAKDRQQAEFVRSIWEYLDKAVSAERQVAGQVALHRHEALLARIEARFGVAKEVVTAIWGLESNFGANRGDLPLIRSLATLAHEGRRGAFFESQLIAALQILQAGDVSLPRLLGSWAGAMGHSQFMPTTYLAHAIDFDGDGRRDIWAEDPTDALASTAAYLAAMGWQKGQPWGFEVTVPTGFDFSQSGKPHSLPVAEWAGLGLAQACGKALPDRGHLSLLLPAGARGAAFLIGPNFHALECYNAADAYVLAVGHLSDRLQGGGPIRGSWPRAEQALTLAERAE